VFTPVAFGVDIIGVMSKAEECLLIRYYDLT